MIKQATEEDISILAKLAIQMWESDTLTELEASFTEIINNKNAVCYIIYCENTPVGFAHCQLRNDYVEGTETTPVGYLEGIFVLPEYRHKGVAKRLLHACQTWAKEKGCSEFASDCELDNKESYEFHMALGFSEANRIICFRKDI